MTDFTLPELGENVASGDVLRVLVKPGDVITTGTPPGVGLGMKPPLFLKKGDVITLGIEGLGNQRQEVVAFRR